MLFRFRDFRVYKDAREFRIYIYKISEKFPKSERFALVDQVRRAVNSIMLNIAEGSNKNSNLDFGRFLNISLSSLEEVVACLDIALDENFIDAKMHTEILLRADNLGRQLLAFMKTVRKY